MLLEAKNFLERFGYFVAIRILLQVDGSSLLISFRGAATESLQWPIFNFKGA